jgi:hypothetical protein
LVGASVWRFAIWAKKDLRGFQNLGGLIFGLTSANLFGEVREVQINNIPVHKDADRQAVGYAALHPPYIGYLIFWGNP